MLGSGASMARRSLRPHLNQIRTWVRQGRTDAWIAHQLEVTVQQIEAFKREQGLAPDEEARATARAPISTTRSTSAPRTTRSSPPSSRRPRPRGEAEDADEDDDGAEENGEDDDERAPPAAHAVVAAARRRGTRGRRGGQPLEGTFDHGEEGYGLWLDPAVQDDPVYAEHWAGHRPVTVTIEEEQIVIRRSGDDNDEEEGD